MEKSSKSKVTIFDIIKIILKRAKISTLLMLIVTFASVSFAWFVYATKVNAGIVAHIEMWNIVFTTDDNEISETVNFVIPNLYPGMSTYTDSVSAHNFGEKSATISYDITEVKILGVNYDTTYSSTIENALANDFPFHITFDLTNETISPGSGTTTFSLSCDWPYESGNDAEDTYWGKRSYTYSSNNPTLPSIEITVRVMATQSVSNTSE